MDNTLADRLADLYAQCGFVDIVSTPQHEVSTKTDPDFSTRLGLWAEVAATVAIRWWQMASSRRRNGRRLKPSIAPGSTIAPWPRLCISWPSRGDGHLSPCTIDKHHMIRAIVFDFDGLILDTELPEFQSWQEIYEAHGARSLCGMGHVYWHSRSL